MLNLNHYIKPDWPAPPNVKAYSTTRLKGHSKPPFDYFNLSFTVGDDAEAVKKNHGLLVTELQLRVEPVWFKQVHGTTAVNIDLLLIANHTSDLSENAPHEADACFTSNPHKVCAIKTADCIPILVCNKHGTEVAAIHAGWRGLLAGVIDSTVKSLSSPPGQLMAWLGPAIGQEHFEINEQIRIDFLVNDQQNRDCFVLKNENHWFANLHRIATHQLNRCGIKDVFGGEYCTFTQSDLFYSHRRDRGITGRMASLIWFE